MRPRFIPARTTVRRMSIHITGQRRFASGATIHITHTRVRPTVTTGRVGSPAVSSSAPGRGTAEVSTADRGSGRLGVTVGSGLLTTAAGSDHLIIEVAPDPLTASVAEPAGFEGAQRGRVGASVAATHAASREAAFAAEVALAATASEAEAVSEVEAAPAAEVVGRTVEAAVHTVADTGNIHR